MYSSDLSYCASKANPITNTNVQKNIYYNGEFSIFVNVSFVQN